jgi:hypothetical protein
MNLQEQINRIQSMMGIINESSLDDMIKDLTFETTSKQVDKQNKEYVCVLDHYRAKIEEMQTEAARFIY